MYHDAEHLPHVVDEWLAVCENLREKWISMLRVAAVQNRSHFGQKAAQIVKCIHTRML